MAVPESKRARPWLRGSLGVHDRTVLRAAAAGVGVVSNRTRRRRRGDPRLPHRGDQAPSPGTTPTRPNWITEASQHSEAGEYRGADRWVSMPNGAPREPWPGSIL